MSDPTPRFGPSRRLGIIAAVTALIVVLLSSGCGSGGELVDPEPAPSAARAPREQMQAQQDRVQQQAEQQVQQDQQEVEVAAEADDGASGDSGDSGETDDATVGRVLEGGHRDGVLAVRNVLGDPNAPVVVTEYSDFQ